MDHASKSSMEACAGFTMALPGIFKDVLLQVLMVIISLMDVGLQAVPHTLHTEIACYVALGRSCS